MADPASVSSGVTDESQGQHRATAQGANSQLGSNTTSGNIPGAFDNESGAPSLQRAPEGVGAVDPSSGRKYHEGTDANPGQFGIQGGAHLNSPDNRPPQDYGTLQGGQAVQGGAFGAGPVKTDQLPPVQNEGGRSDTPQGQDILGPGPAQSKLPPTEPTSERNSEKGAAGALGAGAAGAGAAGAAHHHHKHHHEHGTQHGEHGQHGQHHGHHDQGLQSGGDPTSVGKTQGDPTAVGGTKHDPTSVGGTKGDPTDVGATQGDPTQTSENQARRGSAASDKAGGGQSLGDKIKGLVTEVKGHLRKDPELKEQGRAQHHGEVAGTGATTSTQ